MRGVEDKNGATYDFEWGWWWWWHLEVFYFFVSTSYR
jgi:hypothetical protein